jgi:hypothetical protein
MENSVIGLSVQINVVSSLMFGHRAADGRRLKLQGVLVAILVSPSSPTPNFGLRL